MHRTFETVDASKPLGTPFSRQQQHPDEPLLVTGRDRLVGFGGLDKITKLLRIKRAAAHRPPRALRGRARNRPAHGPAQRPQIVGYLGFLRLSGKVLKCQDN